MRFSGLHKTKAEQGLVEDWELELAVTFMGFFLWPAWAIARSVPGMPMVCVAQPPSRVCGSASGQSAFESTEGSDLHPIIKNNLFRGFGAVAVALGLLLVSTASPAQEARRGYVFGEIGAVDLQTRCANTIRCDGDGASYQLGAGAWLPVNAGGGQLAAEFRWMGMESFRLANQNLNVTLKSRIPMLGLAWWHPISDRWSIGAGAGAAFTRVDAKLTPAGSGTSETTDNRTRLYAMLGLRAALTDATSLQFSLLGTELGFSGGGVDLGQGRLIQASVGLSVAF